MKKVILVFLFCMMCSIKCYAGDRYNSVVYQRPNIAMQNSYNNGYRAGYYNGKAHERDKIARTLVGTGLVVVGIAIIWNIATERAINEPIEYKVRF